MLETLNTILTYLEDHLLEDLDVEGLAKEMGISSYHLKRTFSFLAGMSLADYIKGRRLALANAALIAGESVTTVAFTYGYHSVEGFSRAFKEFSGFLPSEVMKNKWQKNFPPLIFSLQVKGGRKMQFKLEDKAAFNLVGVKKRVPLQFVGENSEIIALAKSITPEQKEQMKALANLYPKQVLNASYNFSEGRLEEKGELTHFIGVATDQSVTKENLEVKEVPAHTWGIFPSIGPFPQALQETWGKIYSEWLPTSGYELVAAPEISFTKFSPDNQTAYSEIWIAVKKMK